MDATDRSRLVPRLRARLCAEHAMELGRVTSSVVNAAMATGYALSVLAYHLRVRHGFTGDWESLAARLEVARDCPICAACDEEGAMEATALQCMRAVEKLRLGFAEHPTDGDLLVLLGPPRAPVAVGFVRVAYVVRAGSHLN